jgi:hypothetical protein
MEQRGRKSTAALSVVAGTQIDGRPRPPADLTERQAEIWNRTVGAEAADVFKTAALQQLLADYCRHVATGEWLSRQIEEAMKPVENGGTPIDLDDLNKLVRLRDCETKASADKATKLRLTNQSRYTPGAAATSAKNSGAERKPWQKTA